MDNTVRLARLTKATQQKVSTLLTDLQDKLLGTLARSNITDFASAAATNKMAAVQELITGTYEEAARALQDAQAGVIWAEYQGVAGVINATIGADIMNATLSVDKLASLVENSLIQGSPAADWWAKQAIDLANRFEETVKLGIASDSTTAEIIKGMMGSDAEAGMFDLTEAQTAALVQTGISESSNDARMDLYRANADVLDGVEQLSVIDDHTTDICIEYDGAQWDLDGNPLNDDDPPFDDGPPRHFNCRSTLLPIVKPLDELA